MKVQKSIVLKRNTKNLIRLLSMVKNISNKINHIKSTIKMILPSRFKKRKNTPKRVSNRGIKSLENNSCVKATKNIINTPKIVIEKLQIVTKPKVVTSSKIAPKVKKVNKPKIVDKSEIVIKKNSRITMNIKIV